MFTTEVFQSDASAWAKIKNGIIFLEQEAFQENAFSEKEITEDFLNKNNIIILLKDNELNEVIGFI